MVVFHDDPEKYNTPHMYLHIQEDMNKIIELNKKITQMEEEIMLTPMFVKKSTIPESVVDDKGYPSEACEWIIFEKLLAFCL